MLRLVLFALLLGVCTSAVKQTQRKATPSQSLSRGWGDSIRWVQSYQAGLSDVVKRKKPMMIIHHQDNCPYSQALKKAFSADKAIQKMAEKDFVMVNLLEETTDENIAPDGHYVPRILFIDPALNVRNEIVGKYQSHLYAYEPTDMTLLAQNMKKAKRMKRAEL